MKRLDDGGICLMLTPPMSREVHAFWGAAAAIGRTASVMGGAVDMGLIVAATSPGVAGLPSASALEILTAFGLVIGIADLATVRAANALARAR